jgi:hypothetical protein
VANLEEVRHLLHIYWRSLSLLLKVADRCFEHGHHDGFWSVAVINLLHSFRRRDERLLQRRLEPKPPAGARHEEMRGPAERHVLELCAIAQSFFRPKHGRVWHAEEARQQRRQSVNVRAE